MAFPLKQDNLPQLFYYFIEIGNDESCKDVVRLVPTEEAVARPPTHDIFQRLESAIDLSKCYGDWTMKKSGNPFRNDILLKSFERVT